MTRLLADIGGTHARFALAEGTDFHSIAIYHTAEFPSLVAAARHYLAAHNLEVTTAAFSVAATLPPGSDRVTFVNLPTWNFSIATLRAELRLDRLDLLNDFEAIAHAVPFLQGKDVQRIGGGVALPHQPIGLIGPGTGLGMAGLLYDGGSYRVIASEGGNASLPLTDARGYALAAALQQHKNTRFLSAEDMLSGPGLVNIYRAIGLCDDIALPPRDAASIADAAITGTCPVCSETLDYFCYLLGVVAGNLALTLNTTGGIYIAGGIIPQWPDHFAASRFRQGFVEKGPYHDDVAAIPTSLIMHPYPAFAGLARLDGK